jgi:hypothetical protein
LQPVFARTAIHSSVQVLVRVDESKTLMTGVVGTTSAGSLVISLDQHRAETGEATMPRRKRRTPEEVAAAKAKA